MEEGFRSGRSLPLRDLPEHHARAITGGNRVCAPPAWKTCAGATEVAELNRRNWPPQRTWIVRRFRRFLHGLFRRNFLRAKTVELSSAGIGEPATSVQPPVRDGLVCRGHHLRN